MARVPSPVCIQTHTSRAKARLGGVRLRTISSDPGRVCDLCLMAPTVAGERVEPYGSKGTKQPHGFNKIVRPLASALVHLFDHPVVDRACLTAAQRWFSHVSGPQASGQPVRSCPRKALTTTPGTGSNLNQPLCPEQSTHEGVQTYSKDSVLWS